MERHPIPSLIRLSDLEARHDGPIPEAERRTLAFGSARAADIADMRAEIAFFRVMIARTRRAGKSWLRRGNRAMAADTCADSWLYLRAWRDRRRRLADLAHPAGARERDVDTAGRRILATIPSEIVAPRSDGTREHRP